MDFRKRVFGILTSFLLIISLASTTPAYEGDGVVESGENKAEELRRAAQNPVADLISIPIQNNTNYRDGQIK